LVEIARAEKMERVIAEILPENTHMQRVCQELGFRMDQHSDGGVRAVMEIGR
jgi:acetyltransferase